ncbi:MAG TPA: type III-A CRISPR-associated protein Csm2 [Desulfomonilia bacterium]
MIKFYMNKEKGFIEPQLFNETADNLARAIAEEGQVEKTVRNKDGSTEKKIEQKKNKRTQIRKFYDEVLMINSRANSKINPEQPEIFKPYINMIIAKAAYAQGRDFITQKFTDFLKDSIKQIDTSNDLKVFTNLFEAFMGFYRLHAKD